MKYIINTDGGARGNPGPAACSALINIGKGESVELKKYLGENTNNFAEYSGVLLAFSWLEANVENKHVVEIDYLLDSLLVVSQLNGEYKIKNAELAKLAMKAKHFEKLYKHVTYRYIPRKENSLADNLVNQCLDENFTG